MHIHTAFISTLSILILTTAGASQSKRSKFKFKVGTGGITAHEYRLYLSVKAREVNKNVRKLTAAEQALAKQKALDDEVLYQAALENGMLSKSSIVETILSHFRLTSKDPKHKAKEFTADQKRAYYNSHKSEFTKPAKMLLRMFHTKTSSEAYRVAAEAQRSVASMKSWTELGWKEVGDKLGTALAKRELDKLYKTREHRVCGPLVDRFQNHYVFFIMMSREKQQIAFSRTGKKLAEQMAKARRTQQNRQFGSHVVKRTDEIAFQAALKKGTQRQWRIRLQIIDEFVTDSKTPRSKLLLRLRAQYGVPAPR